jgi:hypothetical protein
MMASGVTNISFVALILAFTFALEPLVVLYGAGGHPLPRP